MNLNMLWARTKRYINRIALGQGAVQGPPEDIPEAPEDGTLYGRKDGAWAKIENANEQGTFAANEMADFLFLQIHQLHRGVRAAIGESGTVTLTNTQTWPFNNSLYTVALQTPRDTMNYTVTVEIVSATGGAAGAITVANKLLNGFQLSFDGSAASVTVRYNVTGGNI